MNTVQDCINTYKASEQPYKTIAVLKLHVNQQCPELVAKYKEAVEAHNTNTLNNRYYNSGFDLFLPDPVWLSCPVNSYMINLEVKGEMTLCDLRNNEQCPSAYLLYPRSSFSKVPLVMSNHTGIIDSGYRGNLIAAVRWLKEDTTSSVSLDSHLRLFQVCHPSLCPVFVVLVNDASELSTTERGEGGFGSTGK